MNPIETLERVIVKAIESRHLTVDDEESLAACYEQTGVTRPLSEISWDEEYYQQKGLATEDENDNGPSGP